MEPVSRALLSARAFLRLKRGKLARPSRPLRTARSRSRKASWGAHLDTSTHQGACFRFHSFHSLWRSTAEGMRSPRSFASRQRARP